MSGLEDLSLNLHLKVYCLRKPQRPINQKETIGLKQKVIKQPVHNYSHSNFELSMTNDQAERSPALTLELSPTLVTLPILAHLFQDRVSPPQKIIINKPQCLSTSIHQSPLRHSKAIGSRRVSVGERHLSQLQPHTHRHCCRVCCY